MPTKKILPKTLAAKHIDPAEAILDDDATPADAGWAPFSEEEFLKGEKGGKKRAADDAEEEKDEIEDDDELDGFGVDEEE
jgi:hypothetical protein